jgi:outer membrane protein insertion porin family
VAEDIKSIYKMGYFDDVTAEMEPQEGGIKLIYAVKEKPTIVKLDFQGNKEIEDAKLKEKIAVTVGSIADTTLIQDNAQKLELFYEDEGYWLAKIVPIVNRIGENEVSLTYQIEEGGKVRIKKIIIKGNKVMSSSQIKKVMKTSEWSIFSFISSAGYYKRETVSADLESIKDLYFNHGYIKASIANPDIKITDDKDNKKGMTITIEIFEGEQYKIASISVSGNKAYSEADLRKKIISVPGAIFSKETLKKDISGMTDLYTQHGYALANVYPDLVPDEATKTVRVTYKVEEGEIYHLGRIEITGNVKTKDKVIRREVRLDEGDEFNSALLKRSYERLNNLNFFESVELVPKPRYEEKLLDIDVKVKEKATGFVSVGGGYSSVDRLIGMAEITQGNLFGNGQQVKLKGELGSRSTFYELSFKDPWFMDMPIAFNADIYYNTRKFIDYEKRGPGLGFGFGKTFAEYWSANISYNFERPTIYGVALATADQLILQQVGTKTTSSITPTLTRDTRDNYLDPSRGSRNSVYVTFAGLGGSNSFIKGVADSAWFFPLGNTSFMLRGRVGYGTALFNRDFPLYERFYVGGINTVRGLGFGDAGPKGSLGENIGGQKELIFNAEYIYPIVQELRLKGVVFADAGNSYNISEPFGTLRYTSGTGIRWISPMGPIRVEWGYNIQRKPGEPGSKVEFAFGSFF